MDRKGTARGTGIRRVLAWIVGIALVASITWAGPAGATLMQGSAKHDPADRPVALGPTALLLAALGGGGVALALLAARPTPAAPHLPGS